MALITAEELLAMPDEDALIELVDGEIEKKPLNGVEHGLITAGIGFSLDTFVRQRGLGVTLAAGTGFILRRDPDTVRSPDVAFVSKARYIRTTSYLPGPPDLAVEVISPNETYSEVNAKLLDWLRSGVRLLIVVHLSKQSADIHRSMTETQRVDIDGALDGGDVVPGWQLPLRELFA